MRRITVFLAIIFLASTVFTFYPAKNKSVGALSGSQFRAGRIIDDSIFFNGSAMSQAQIQNFLNSKVPVCDRNHPRTSHPNDSGPPYTCLKDYVQTTPTRAASPGLCGKFQGGTYRAARIIHDVSKVCGVSQKVILVLLQKEQSLVTDTWPWKIQYTKATGYGCPDTSLPSNVDRNDNGCYDQYEGFFNQIYYAARQYKNYKINGEDFNYRSGRRSYVQWHPNASCGGSYVTMENHATAGLYNYTPYRPNKAALDNLYGTGNSCSSYGNRNFWRMYNDWFGSTLTNPGTDKAYVGDWDNDGKDEIGLRRLDEYFLTYNHAAPAEAEFIYGLPKDKHLVGDWDGDGRDEIGVKRDKNYYLNNENDSVSNIRFAFGRGSDQALVGDWDGDGRDEIGLKRGRDYFFDHNGVSGAESTLNFGRPTDQVIVGDWNGDGKDNIGLKRGNDYFFDYDGLPGAEAELSFGRDTDKPFVGNWDNDSRDEVALRRGKEYFFDHNGVSGAEAELSFGRVTDMVLYGNWDNDSRDEIGLKRGKDYFLDYDYISGSEVEFSFGR